MPARLTVDVERMPGGTVVLACRDRESRSGFTLTARPRAIRALAANLLLCADDDTDPGWDATADLPGATLELSRD
jgi:hypothetical protein